MKTFARLLAITALALGLSSCLFKEPVFTSGFGKVDGSLAGVWMAESDNHDPRERSFAVVAPVGDALMIHYPVNEKGASYLEARPVKVGGRDLLQIKLVATYEDGVPEKDTPVYTLLWLVKDGADTFTVRTMSQEGTQTASPAAAKKALEAKGADWEKLFGKPIIFTRLPAK